MWSYGNRMGGGIQIFFLFVISKFPTVEFHTWDFLRCGVLLNSTQSPPTLQNTSLLVNRTIFKVLEELQYYIEFLVRFPRTSIQSNFVLGKQVECRMSRRRGVASVRKKLFIHPARVLIQVEADVLCFRLYIYIDFVVCMGRWLYMPIEIEIEIEIGNRKVIPSTGASTESTRSVKLEVLQSIRVLYIFCISVTFSFRLFPLTFLYIIKNVYFSIKRRHDTSEFSPHWWLVSG